MHQQVSLDKLQEKLTRVVLANNMQFVLFENQKSRLNKAGQHSQDNI